jgi:general secretion pathway protein G
MISTYQRLQRQRDAGEIDGFTLIELLIVIVVLGILAAVVIFALGGITGKSAVASCQADGATVSTALAAFNAQNPTVLTNVAGTGGTTVVPPATPAYGSTAASSTYTVYYATAAGTTYTTTATNLIGTIAIGTPTTTATPPVTDSAIEGLLSTSASTYQGPYVQSWPNNASHYGYVLGWVQTGVATATPLVQATWTAQLFIVTGDTYASGPVYTATSSVNGNLTQTIIDSATPIGANGTTSPYTVGLYPYSGPGVCSVVS